MSSIDDMSPRASCGLAVGSRDPVAAVDLLLDRRLMGTGHDRLTPEMTETLRLALSEILAGIFQHAGPGAATADAQLNLWLQPDLLICTVRFYGHSLPNWLLANWDRAREPGQLAPSEDCGWGWLLVREAIDCVSYDRIGGAQLLFLEKRL